MKVVGFTFVRNAVRYDYPIVETIRSMLPLCDQVIVSIGNSDDGTVELIRSIESPKLFIHHSTWDDSLREGGRVLAVETDKAFDLVPPDADWCLYLQADEVIHEKYYGSIQAAMEKCVNHPEVEGLLFKYVHFYASYDYVGDSRKWYGHEIRIIRNDHSIRSYRDAQGFRKEGRKLYVKPIDACIYHYGWVRHPLAQVQKLNNFVKLWGASEQNPATIPKTAESLFDYSTIDSLAHFTGTHPEVMQERIRKKNWTFDYDITKKKFSLKGKFLRWLESISGKRFFEYKNYKII